MPFTTTGEDSIAPTSELVQSGAQILGSPEQCAKVVAGAVAARNPRTRYLVGLDAQWTSLADRFTPTLIQDRVIRTALGL